MISTKRKMTFVPMLAVPGGLGLSVTTDPQKVLWLWPWAVRPLGGLSIVLLAISAIFAVLVLADFLRNPKSWLKKWKVQWPLARVDSGGALARTSSTASTPPPSPKYYSRGDKERLSELYTELSQLLLANGANGSGGLFMALAVAGNELATQNIRFSQGLEMDTNLLLEKWQTASDASGAMYTALYGNNAIIKKPGYLSYGDEIRSALRDTGGQQIGFLQGALNGYGAVLRALKSANKYNDKRLMEEIIQASGSTTTEYQNAIGRFQSWMFESNQRIQSARNLLTE